MDPALYHEFTDDPRSRQTETCYKCHSLLPPSSDRRPVFDKRGGPPRMACGTCWVAIKEAQDKNRSTPTVHSTSHSVSTAYDHAQAPAFFMSNEKVIPAQLHEERMGNVDMQGIRGQIAAAQRGVKEGVPVQRSSLQGAMRTVPSVAVQDYYWAIQGTTPQALPPASPRSGSSQWPTPGPAAIGYTSNHEYHPLRAQAMAKTAAAADKGLHLNIKAELRRTLSGKPEGEVIGEGHEGLEHIPVTITSEELKVLLYRKLYAHISKAFPQADVHLHELTLRNWEWVNLDEGDPQHQVFRTLCYPVPKAGGRPKLPEFKRPARPPMLFLVLSSDMEAEVTRRSMIAQSSTEGPPATQPRRRPAHLPDSNQTLHQATFQVTPNGPSFTPTNSPSQAQPTITAEQLAAADAEEELPDNPLDGLYSGGAATVQTPQSKSKRPREMSSPQTPDRPAMKKPSQFVSPDSREALALLREQTSSAFESAYVMDDRLQRIQMCEVERKTWQELAEEQRSGLRPDWDSAIWAGRLRTSSIGTAQGGFKIMEQGVLTLDNTPGTRLVNNLGRQSNHRVAVKRFYHSKNARYGYSVEVKLVKTEANTNRFANAMLGLAYGFLERELTRRPVPPPFQILYFRFVETAIVYTEQVKPENRRCFLVEEFIDGSYVKYMNNDIGVPTPELTEGDKKKALFLAFLQHVIYEKTGHGAVVSDLQGK